MFGDPVTSPGRYRVRFLVDTFEVIVLPVALLRLMLWWFDIHPPFHQVIPLYPASIAICKIATVLWRSLQQSREARSLNARQVPRVVGKWPGNFDILLRMIRAFKTSYVGDVYLQLFEEYQTTTLNLRVLWSDTVSAPF
jgi:hypothetical protein